jgi:hypothetical protein
MARAWQVALSAPGFTIVTPSFSKKETFLRGVRALFNGSRRSEGEDIRRLAEPGPLGLHAPGLKMPTFGACTSADASA